MKAAVIASPGMTPTYRDYVLPQSRSAPGPVVDLLATALHPEVRFERDHLALDRPTYPRVPGMDGVGCTSGGTVRYFLLPGGATGSMADRALIDLRRSVALDEHCDLVAMAAILYPALSCWEALRDQMGFSPGHTVLVLGADEADGRLSVQLARILGAGAIIAVCRDENADLFHLGATETIGPAALRDDVLGSRIGEIDVVLDHLGESPTFARLARAVVCRRSSRRGAPLPWFRTVPSTAAAHQLEMLASAARLPIHLVERDVRRYLALDLHPMIATLCAEVDQGGLRTDARVFPLAAVDQAWERYEPQRRNVLVAGGDDALPPAFLSWMQRRRLDWFL